MLMTRNACLAPVSNVGMDTLVYFPEPLSLEAPWPLIFSRIFQGHSCPDYLQTSRSVSKNIWGVPVAIVTICGTLATRVNHGIDDPEMVRRSLGAEIRGNNKVRNLNKLLSLSFDDFPFIWKHVFCIWTFFHKIVQSSIGPQFVCRLQRALLK